MKVYSQTDRFLQSVRNALDDSVTSIDARTRERIARARASAVAGASPNHNWAPAGAIAFACCAALVFAIVRPDTDALDTGYRALEVMTTLDELELFEELEFYEWLEEYELPS